MLLILPRSTRKYQKGFAKANNLYVKAIWTTLVFLVNTNFQRWCAEWSMSGFARKMVGRNKGFHLQLAGLNQLCSLLIIVIFDVDALPFHTTNTTPL